MEGSSFVRLGTLAVSCLLAVLMGACSSDYTALRDWSQQAREAVLPGDVPRGVQVPQPSVTRRQPGSHADAVLVLQTAAAGWLAALSAMADDAYPPADGGVLRREAARVAAVDPEGAAAVMSIGDAIDYVAARGWSASQLGYAVDFADPHFQAVMAALVRQTPALAAAGAAPGERHDTARLSATLATLTRVAEGHALLKQRERLLAQGDTSRTLRAEASELRRLMAVVSSLPAVSRDVIASPRAE
jgi:hypothetical protein